MNIHKTRGILYKLAKLLGDLSALKNGRPEKITKRITRRMTGKATSRLFKKIFK
jgi:hypothetical protein